MYVQHVGLIYTHTKIAPLERAHLALGLSNDVKNISLLAILEMPIQIGYIPARFVSALTSWSRTQVFGILHTLLHFPTNEAYVWQ